MKTVLISTTCLWNCGDDFIREGVLELLKLKPEVRKLWWNRGFGARNAYANDLEINLPLMDYFIVAGTPEWIYNNERIYKYCLKHELPMCIIGVGTRNIIGLGHWHLIKKVAQSGLCEVALARDEEALGVFKEFGFKNSGLILDPAFFMPPLEVENIINILGWRDYFIECEPSFPLRYPHRWLYGQMKNRILKRQLWGKSKMNYDKLMYQIFRAMRQPKMVIVHDNNEVKKAEKLFGPEYVFYSSDYHEIFTKYSQARNYVGSRIHGAIPSLIHGAPVYLIYTNPKAKVLETSVEILSQYNPEIFQNVKLSYFSGELNFQEYETGPLEQKTILAIIEQEKQRVRKILQDQPILRNFIEI